MHDTKVGRVEPQNTEKAATCIFLHPEVGVFRGAVSVVRGSGRAAQTAAMRYDAGLVEVVLRCAHSWSWEAVVRTPNPKTITLITAFGNSAVTRNMQVQASSILAAPTVQSAAQRTLGLVGSGVTMDHTRS